MSEPEKETIDAPSPPAPGFRRRALRGGAIFLGAKLLAQAFQWSVTLLVVRLLEPEDYSLMTLGTLFTGIADMLADAGVGKALVQKRDLEDDDLPQAFTLAVLLSLGLYAILFVAAPFLAVRFKQPEFTLFLRVLGLLLAFIPFRTVGWAMLERQLLLGKQSAVQLGASFLQASVVLTLAWLGFGYWALAAGALMSAFVQTCLVFRVVHWRPKLAMPTRRCWGLFRFGIQVSLAGLLWMLYSNADYIVVAELFTPQVLGFYSVAFELMSLPVQKISANVNQVMFSLFSRYQDDPRRVRDWYLRLVAIMTLFCAPALIGLALVAADGIPLILGQRWEPAVLPFQILCPVGVLMIVGTSMSQFLSARGHPEYNTIYALACAIVYPPAFWFAGQAHGIAGICWVWVAVYPCQIALLVHLTRRVSGITLGDLLVSQRLVMAGCGLMTAVVLGVRTLMIDLEYPAVRLFVMIAAGAVSYAGFMLSAGRNTLLANLGKMIRGLRE